MNKLYHIQAGNMDHVNNINKNNILPNVKKDVNAINMSMTNCCTESHWQINSPKPPGTDNTK